MDERWYEMQKKVNVDSLNFRLGPSTQAGIIGTLTFANSVDVVGPPASNGFVEVTTKIQGQKKQGFVSAQFLRDPVSDARELLVEKAVAQWLRFNRGEGEEHKDPFFKFVGEFWESIGKKGIDGKDRGIFWSAAFISFIVRQAKYQNFQFAESHSRYIIDAKNQRLANNANAPFWLVRLNEHKPQMGDLICQWRDHKTTFDDVSSDLDDFFPSHSDVVVAIRGNKVEAIGGNVSQSVSVTDTFRLDANGHIKAPPKAFAIMKNLL